MVESRGRRDHRSVGLARAEVLEAGWRPVRLAVVIVVGDWNPPTDAACRTRA
jgi:hypothetical protein